MKPTRNNVYCPECGRTKMLFDEETKAMNFIRFNSEEMQRERGVAPTRAYFCIACCGWHVTSSEYRHKVSRSEIVIRQYRKAEHQQEEYAKRARTQRHKTADYPQLPDRFLAKAQKKVCSYEKRLKKGENLELLAQSCLDLVRRLETCASTVKQYVKYHNMKMRLVECANGCRIMTMLNDVEKHLRDAQSYLDNQMAQAANERLSEAISFMTEAMQIKGFEERKRHVQLMIDACVCRKNQIWEKLNFEY